MTASFTRRIGRNRVCPESVQSNRRTRHGSVLGLRPGRRRGFSGSRRLTRSYDFPTTRNVCRIQEHSARGGHAIHEPCAEPSLRHVLPYQICLSVAVEIDNGSDSPSLIVDM